MRRNELLFNYLIEIQTPSSKFLKPSEIESKLNEKCLKIKKKVPEIYKNVSIFS